MSGEPFWYPSVEDIIEIHDEIVSEYEETSSGVRNRGAIEFAVEYLEHGPKSEGPMTVHETAYHLLRLLVANHPFVDGNKRTALNTVTTFYYLNGYRFEYDHTIRTHLNGFATDEQSVDSDEVLDYLQEQTTEFDLEQALRELQDDLVEYGLERLGGRSDDPNR